MSLFEESHYADAIKITLARARKIDRTKTLTRMAEAVQVQQPYLSKVLSKKANFNSDQLYRCCQFLELTPEERNFLLLLLEKEKCEVPERRKELNRRIENLQAKKLDTSQYVRAKALDVQDLGAAAYYLDPILQLIHVGLTIKAFRKTPLNLARELRISNERFFQCLKKLMNLQLVRETKDGYEVTQHQLHLSKDSPVYAAWKGLTRQLAIERLYSVRSKDTYNFSVVFSADEKLRKAMQVRLLEVVREFEEKVREVEPKHVYQLSMDLFSWTDS